MVLSLGYLSVISNSSGSSRICRIQRKKDRKIPAEMRDLISTVQNTKYLQLYFSHFFRKKCNTGTISGLFELNFLNLNPICYPTGYKRYYIGSTGQKPTSFFKSFSPLPLLYNYLPYVSYQIFGSLLNYRYQYRSEITDRIKDRFGSSKYR
jgi:hypothetical protein